MNILFVHNGMRSFVRTDLEILESKHNVLEADFTWSPKCLRALSEEIRKCSLVFGWWGSWHMLLPVLLAKLRGIPVIVAGGDYDVIYDINHGVLRDAGRYWLGHVLFRLLDAYIVQSDYSRLRTLAHRHITASKVKVIPHGFSDIADGWPCKKRNSVLTVGTVSRTDVYRKGLETFVRASAMIPDVDFQLVGPWQDNTVQALRSINDANISYRGFVSSHVLHKVMSESQVYVQVSAHEGFGCALAEAMLFKCIPVVTRRGAIPEVVVDNGLYVPFGDVRATADAIRMALGMDEIMGNRARAHILSHFPLEKRRDMLLQLVDCIASRQPAK